MELTFSAEIWFWKGPSPWHFVSVPDELCPSLEAVSGAVSYGWGMIPVNVRIRGTKYYTALWPKDGGYIVPLKAAVRKAEKLVLGQVIQVQIDIDV